MQMIHAGLQTLALLALQSQVTTPGYLERSRQAQVSIVAQTSGTTARLRGIHSSGDLGWASGQRGTVLRTRDGGAHWQLMRMPDGEELDFRAVQSNGGDEALVFSAGSGRASQVFTVRDDGRTWIRRFQAPRRDDFFDCVDFRIDDEGHTLLGDPVDGRFGLWRSTHVLGWTWAARTPSIAAKPGEAAFAASNGCITHGGDGDAYVVTGGGATRVHRLSRFGGMHWITLDTPFNSARSPSAGLFAATPWGAGVLAVGGDYKQPAEPGYAVVVQGGPSNETTVTVLPAPRGYRSGVACTTIPVLYCIAVGESGVDGWDGEKWTPLSDVGYDAISLHNGVGWMTGADGRIARVRVVLESTAP